MTLNVNIKISAGQAMHQILANTIPFCFTTYHDQDLPTFNTAVPGKPSRTKPAIPQKLVHCSVKIYDLLDPSELRIIYMICNDLKHNNALWYYNSPTLEEEDIKAIESLIEKKILYPTESSCFFIVNPLAIRRGRISSVIAATTELIGKNIGLNNKMIKRISPSPGYMTRLYNTQPIVPADSTASKPFMGDK